MKYRPWKILIALLLAGIYTNPGLYAQTVLVHTAPVKDGSDENLQLYNQSVEAGIMDVLFETGCITFSEMSDMDESDIAGLALKTGSDYILSWKLTGSGLSGSLRTASGSESVKTVTVSERDLKGEYQTPQDLYTALGSTLCKSLVGDRW